VTGVLADINIQGHVDVLVHLLESDAWIELWRALGLRYITFRDVGLNEQATDATVWQLCQEQGYVLITSNRNQKSPDSLEATIRDRSTPDSLPVLTLADAERFRNDREYAGRVAASLLQTLYDIESFRGAGRLYLP
jgi:hypothetical protein